jgi:hypothetical protein
MFGMADLSFELFDALEIADPRSGIGPDIKPRDALMDGTIKAFTDKYTIDWNRFDHALLWYAQATDMFGDEGQNVPLPGGGSKQIGVAVLDLLSPYDSSCQELGHAFGFKHERTRDGGDYGSPYSSMSAQVYGGATSSFQRARDTRLPDGQFDPTSAMFPQRVVGPIVPAAQLLRFDWFRDSSRVVNVPADYGASNPVVELTALDHGRLRADERLPVLAVIPATSGGRTFTVELRRQTTAFDTVIGHPTVAGAPRAGLVVHSIDGDGIRFYEGTLPLQPVSQRGWVSGDGRVVLRVESAAADLERVQFAVTVPGQQQHVFGRGSSGAALHLFWDAATGTIYFDDWTARAGAPAMAGAPTALAWRNQQHIFYRDDSGAIDHIFWAPELANPIHDVWSARAGIAPRAAGDPASMSWPNQQHVFYRSTSGGIDHVFWDEPTNTVYFDDWTAKSGAALAASDPATLLWHDQQHVFYRTTNNTIGHVFWGPGMQNPAHDDWNHAAGGGAPVAGKPTTLFWENQQHVFYRGAAGEIGHVFWDQPTNRVYYDDWTHTAGAPPAAGDPATLLSHGQQHVFYRTGNSTIAHIFWGPGMQHPFHDDWTAQSSSPGSAGEPATLATPGQQHVFHRTPDGKLNHIFWDGSFHRDEWTEPAGSPPLGSDVATMLTGA